VKYLPLLLVLIVTPAHAETIVTALLDLPSLTVTDPTAFTLTSHLLTVRDGHHAPLVCQLLVDTLEEERGVVTEHRPFSVSVTLWDFRTWRVLCPLAGTPTGGTFTFDRTTVRSHERSPAP